MIKITSIFKKEDKRPRIVDNFGQFLPNVVVEVFITKSHCTTETLTVPLSKSHPLYVMLNTGLIFNVPFFARKLFVI